jgi:ankyrin repeat protein
LHAAATNSHAEIVRLLLQKGAGKESKIDGFSALDIALVKRDPDTISALLEVQDPAS